MLKRNLKKFKLINRTYIVLAMSCFIAIYIFSRMLYKDEITYKSVSIINEPTNKRKVILFAGVFSYLTWTDRRNAIRATWLKDCKNNQQTVCKFVIDALDNEGKNIAIDKRKAINDEDSINEDLIVLESFAGINFAYRLYKLMEWVYDRYDFDFFLRIDDDNYLCFDRLIYELPYRKEKYIIWGVLKCQKDLVRIDEGFMIISRDLFDTMMDRYDTLMCHKHGGVAVAMWLVDIQKSVNVSYFQDDGRIPYSSAKASERNLCHKYLDLHRTYPNDMRVFHQRVEEERKEKKLSYFISPLKNDCQFSTKTFKSNNIVGKAFATPMLCIEKPLWNDIKVWLGSEKRPKKVT